jgi:putative ABC transport system permease protein
MIGRLLAMSARRLAQQPGRALLLALGIAIGVAMALGIHLINRSAVGEFVASVRATAGDADLQVVGGRTGFAEDHFPQVARRADVAVASPVVELDAVVVGRPDAIRVIGVDAFRALALDPALAGADPRLAVRLLEPDTVLLSAALAGAMGLQAGGTLRVVVGLEEVALRVAGVVENGSLRGEYALADISTAQWRLDRLGRLNRLDVRLRAGADVARAEREIQATLPAGVVVTTPAARSASSARLSQAYRVNLNVLALVALFTGGFLVFSAQMLDTVRRRTEHALLRVIGLTRRGLVALVLGEAAVVGAIGAAAGVAGAHAIAYLALSYVGGDLGAGQFRGLQPQLAPAPLATAAFFALGIATALAGSLMPALDAARAAPARALRAGDAEAALGKGSSPLLGGGLAALGIALAFGPPVDGVPILGYLSIMALVIAGIALMPATARLVFARLASPRHPVIALSASQLSAAPGQATVSLAAMVASFSLMVAMGIMVSSFRTSVDDWLRGILGADLYFRTSVTGETAWLEAGDERRIAGIPGIARAEFLRTRRLHLDAARPPVLLLAREIDAARAARVLPLVGPSVPAPAGGPPPVWVSEAMVDLYGFRPGDTVSLPLDGTLHPVHVAGVWRDYARQHGSIVMPRPTYVALTGDSRSTDGSLWLAPGATAGEVLARIREIDGGSRLEIADPGEIRAASLAAFDRSFAVTYLLEAVAILVGLFGLATSLAAIVFARRREFGMLRHVGMTRREVSLMVTAEGGLIALLGVAAGGLVGGALSVVLIFVVNRQSFHWSMDFDVPWGFLGALAAVTLALATATSWLASRGATGGDAVRAVREDW